MNRIQRSTERKVEPSAPSGGSSSQGWPTIGPVRVVESVQEMREDAAKLLRDTASRLRVGSQYLGEMADFVENVLGHIG